MPAYEADKERFAGCDAQVLGISVDSIPSHVAWARSLGGITYDLLADFHPKGEVAKKYGAWREADGISERALFIVDKEGKIAYIDIHDISDQPDNEDLFEVLRKL
jgi:peroxiredoxin